MPPRLRLGFGEDVGKSAPVYAAGRRVKGGKIENCVTVPACPQRLQRAAKQAVPSLALLFELLPRL